MYSYCEAVTASSISPYCVRELTQAGKKLSGGIDSDSLCGRVTQKRGGWDVDGVVDVLNIALCPKCKRLLEGRA